jgi:PT repeat
VPTKQPTKTPTYMPTKTPTYMPTVQPTKPPTKAPTAEPTKQPTKAPTIPCGTSDIAIEAYVNSITLSSKTLSLSGNNSLDLALKQLVASNNETLSTCLAADQKRLNQRFAYLAFMFSTNGKDKVPSWFAKTDECDWTGVTCSHSTVTKLDLHGDFLKSKFLKGTIPDDVGLLTGLDAFAVYENQLAGSLPSSIGLWTALLYFGAFTNQLTGSLPSSIGLWTSLSYFDVSINQLTGTVPKDVANWTSIQYAYFRSNNFNGTMPAIGNNFCPKKGTGFALWADCGEIQCGCCNLCCASICTNN